MKQHKMEKDRNTEKENLKTVKKHGLGRGLSSLMEDDNNKQFETENLKSKNNAISSIPIEKIVPNQKQPRKLFKNNELKSLADSIKSKGIIQPLIIKRSVTIPEQYEIIAGERRWRAAQMAQLTEVPVTIRNVEKNEELELAIIENVQREELTAIEEAYAYKRLTDEFKYTQEKVSKLVGKSRSHIANTIRLLNLPMEVKKLLENGDISAGHGRAILSSKNPIERAHEIIGKKLNVRTVEKKKKANVDSIRIEKKDANTKELEKNISEAIGYSVDIEFKKQNDSGSVRINYRNLDQLDDIVHRLLTPR